MASLPLVTRAVIAWLVVAAASITSTRSIAESPTDSDRESVQLKRLREDVAYLASEELRGRSVADDTILLAADYIADRMNNVGLDTTSFGGSPFQQVAISLGPQAGPAANNRVVIRIEPQAPDAQGSAGESDSPNEADHRGTAIVADLGDGMNPMAIGSTRGQLTGPVVFAGYGITAPKLGYDDYSGIDVAGSIVVIMRKEPQANDPDSRFDGTKNTRHAFFSTKIQNAIRHGASAIIFVNDRDSISEKVDDQKRRIAAELERRETIQKQIAGLPAEATNSRETLAKRIAGIDSMVESMTADLQRIQRGVLGISDAGDRPPSAPGEPVVSIPVVSIARDLVDQMTRQTTGKTVGELEASIHQSLRPASEVLSGVSITMAVDMKEGNRESPNVVGVLEGRGPMASETVVVGAHYDHVGMGGVGSLAPGTIAVHNGADDNASGTAAMLATAAAMVQRLADVPDHRRIVFIAFTGEERGLLGSKYYVRHPRFSIDATVAMINLDMVGRVRDNELTVYGTGSADSIESIVDAANAETQFDLFKVPTGYGPSDHQSFYEVGVPVLFFFTGLHNDYHRPSDDFGKIDFGGLTRITDITCNSTFELATRRERPRYAVTDRQVQIRRQMTAFLGVTLSDRGDQVAITGLTPGGPAEQSGIRVGDRLNTIAGKPIRRSSDVLERLRNQSPGDEVKIEVFREGKSVLLVPRLVARPDR
ncbi:M28 family peptidase [Rubripirellula lacrimiformis]|nr:M28 family peptidase [Rubripirellula lacrimiformis]